MVSGCPLSLYVGTDVGLFAVETASARDASIPNWKFYYSFEPTSIASNIDDLRAIGALGGGNPATVNSLVADGPEGGEMQVVWFGTPSGLHKIDLLSGLITHGGDYEHPGVDGETVPATNEIYSLASTGDEVIIGSGWGMWVLNGGYSAVYGMTNQEWVPGLISSIVVHPVSGIDTVFLGIGPG